MGWDDDVDEELRRRPSTPGGRVGRRQLGESVDVVLLWWRSGDGDLADELITDRAELSGTGFRVVDDTDNGPPDHVDPVAVSEPPTSPGCTSPPGSTGAIGSGPGSPSPAHPPLVHARPPHQPARWRQAQGLGG
ncbi:DUF3052 family protein [Rhodococcus sp. T7]|uniref:DUF3052 family protein n=1 Tax=Rhodococcus sp. T7 TaxID=627444 RepID=UPI003FA7595F